MSESEDITQITQLILRERQGRDRAWWQQMREAFAPDSTVHLSWYRGDGPGFVTGSERMSSNGDKAVHRLSPPVIHLHDQRAIAELACGVEFQVRIQGTPAHLVSYTRLNYRLRKRDGVWAVVQLDAIYERDSLTPAFPGDRIEIASTDLNGYRPSYALLSHYLHNQGYDVADDLLGDDRPEDVTRFYQQSRTWFHSARTA